MSDKLPSGYEPYADLTIGDVPAIDLGESIAEAARNKSAGARKVFGKIVSYIVPALNEKTGEIEDIDLNDVEITKDKRDGFFRLVDKAGEHKVTTGALILGALALGGAAVAWQINKNRAKSQEMRESVEEADQSE